VISVPVKKSLKLGPMSGRENLCHSPSWHAGAHESMMVPMRAHGTASTYHLPWASFSLKYLTLLLDSSGVVWATAAGAPQPVNASSLVERNRREMALRTAPIVPMKLILIIEGDV
jgi:hypothetical protein